MSATSAAAQSYNRWLVTNHRFFWRINPKIRRFSKRRIWPQKVNCTNNPPKVVKKKEARGHTVKFYLQGTILLLFSLAFGSPLSAPLCSCRTGPLAKSQKPRSSRAVKISLQEGEWRHPKTGRCKKV